MKTARLLAAFAAISVAYHSFGQVTLAKWTFETSVPSLTNSATITGLVAEQGIFSATSFASGTHASANTDWSNPQGNGSTESLSVNTWAANDFFQFQTSTTGYDTIQVSWDQTGSATGPRDFSLQYSTNGTSFTAFSSYTLVENATPNNWSGTTLTGGPTNFSFSLSAVSSLNSITGVYFRLVNTSTTSIGGGAIGNTGASRVDNFTVMGTAAIPEPSTYAAIFGAAALVGAAVHRRRQRAKIATV